MTAISFNGNSLQTSTIITSDIDHHDLATKNVSIFPVAHGNKSKITFTNHPSRKIVVAGKLVESSNAALDTLIDTFKGYLVGTDKNLDIAYAGSTRRYIATVTGAKLPRPGGLAWGDFEIQFTCSIPFGVDTSLTTLLTVTAHTGSPKTDAVTIGGNAEYQYPILTLTLNSGTGLSAATITVGNDQNGQEVSITRNWAAADVLVVDPYNDLVTVNDDEVDFEGALTSFNPGAANFTYADTFLTRSVTYTLKQYRYWL